jgi:hypothetical protein
MVIELEGRVIAQKTFSVLMEYGDGELLFWKKKAIERAFLVSPSVD